jgi:transcriptional regulator with XRE-family HTH domain
MGAKKKTVSKREINKRKRGIAGRMANVRNAERPRSQREFARNIGVFQQNVNRYESGTTPSTEFCIRLALAENVSIDWLLLGVGEMFRK